MEPEETLGRLINFIGYGSSTPTVVFCGLEEATTEVNYEQKLKARIDGGRGSGIMDLGGFQGAKGCGDIWAGISDDVQRTWRPFIKLLMAVEKSGRHMTAINGPEILDYQKSRWGRAGSAHLLTELFPLPKPSRRTMPNYWQGLFPNCSAYFGDANLWKHRKTALRNAINHAHGSESLRLVVCYGKSEWSKYRELFDFEGQGEDIITFSRRTGLEIPKAPALTAGKVLVEYRERVLYALTYHPVGGLSNSEMQAVVDLHRRLQ